MPCPRHSDGYRISQLEGRVHWGFAMGPGKFHFLNSVVIGLYIRIIVGRTGVSYILHLYSPGPSLLVV